VPLSEYLAFTNPFAADAAGWLAPGICSDNECRPLHHGFDHIRPFFDRYSGFVQPTQLLHPQTDASAIRKRRHTAGLCYSFWDFQQPTLPTRNPCSLGTFPFRSLLLPITTSNKKITTKMTAIRASNCPAQHHRQILGYGPYNACTAKKSALAMEAPAEPEILAGLTRGVQVQICPGCKKIGGPMDGCSHIVCATNTYRFKMHDGRPLRRLVTESLLACPQTRLQ
jgi:hypothetical protein